jgi:glycosyltransferase involved in cell wall biosynthesis
VSRIVGAIVARDPGRHLRYCLDSLAWTDAQLVVLDSRTTDDSATVATDRGAQVVIRDFSTFPRQRNAALETIRDRGLGDWVMFLDHDERATSQLAIEARAVTNADGPTAPVGYWIPRRDFIWGRWIRHGGWWPDHQLRLLRVDRCHYDVKRDVHELVEMDGPSGQLVETMLHYNYDTLEQFLEKQRHYSRLEAQRLRRLNRGPRPWSPLLQSCREFHRRFVKLEGYRDGWRGFVLATLLGWYTARTYSDVLISAAGIRSEEGSRPGAKGQ